MPRAQDLAALSVREQPSPTAAGETGGSAPPPPALDKLAHVEPEMSLGQGSAAVEQAVSAAASEPETPITSVDETMAKAVEPSPAASEPVSLPAVVPEPPAPRIAAPEIAAPVIAAPVIAALGGSPKAVDPQARDKQATNGASAKGDRNFLSNRQRAQRAKARRRLAHRTRMVRPAAVQQQPAAGVTGVPATTATVPTTGTPFRF